jgi:hypothetical protein
VSDRLERFEAELSSLRPLRLPAGLVDRIGAQLPSGKGRPWADRCLLSTMCAGALAASVIVVTLLKQSAAPLPPALPMQAEVNAPRFGDYAQALARADAAWLDTVK